MSKLFLYPEEKKALEIQHKTEKNGYKRDRIKVVLLRSEDWSYVRIAQALRIDESTVRQHEAEYVESRKLSPENGGSESKLNEEQTKELKAHLETHTYRYAKDICTYVKSKYGVEYSVSGMTKWLKKNGFVHKKPKLVPKATDPLKQAAFVETYEELKRSIGDDEVILFSDAVHPEHQSKAAYGWIRKGTDKQLPTTAKQHRLHFCGALDLVSMQVIMNEFETINAETVKLFFSNIESHFQNKTKIHIIVDNAAYYRSKEVRKALEGSKIRLIFLPPYSPNLNPIERFWKIMHENVRNNRFYEHFCDFGAEVKAFFNDKMMHGLMAYKSRINDKFNIITTSNRILEV